MLWNSSSTSKFFFFPFFTFSPFFFYPFHSFTFYLLTSLGFASNLIELPKQYQFALLLTTLTWFAREDACISTRPWTRTRAQVVPRTTLRRPSGPRESTRDWPRRPSTFEQLCLLDFDHQHSLRHTLVFHTTVYDSAFEHDFTTLRPSIKSRLHHVIDLFHCAVRFVWVY